MVNEGKYTLQRTNLSEQIFEILKEQIAEGQWKPGEKFISENELADQFGVSRMSARNALQRLCALGLLETRQGGGTFVKEFSLASYFEKASDLIASKQSMDEIRQFRFYFERDCMELACETRKEEDIRELKEIYRRMGELSETEDIDAFFEADMDFHQRICEMTGNQVFVMVNTLLRELLLAQLKDNTMRYATIKNASMQVQDENYALKILLKEHWNYVDALEHRDPSRAVNQLQTYISKYITMPK